MNSPPRNIATLGILSGAKKTKSKSGALFRLPPKTLPWQFMPWDIWGLAAVHFLGTHWASTYPRQFQVFVEISFGQYQGVEELYRALYGLHVVSSLADTIIAFDEFSAKDYPSQIAEIAKIVSELTNNGKSLIVVDDGGVYDEQGDYQIFFRDLIAALNTFDRPVLSFSQTRMMPFARRRKLSTFFPYLPEATNG